jgi:2-hydroxychromene-2-carboxylate isomerase
MPAVDFYFYYGCPWTYMAFGRLVEAAMRTNARIAWKPILVERVRAALGPGATAHPAEAVPARARYQRKDMADWARFCGINIRRPGPFPVAATWSLRGAVTARDAGVIVPYSEAVFRACFESGRDIDSLETVSAIAAEIGVDAAAFAAATRDPTTLRAIDAASDELVDRGGFGSPSMFIGDDLYFGNDRMPLVELALTRAAERPLIVPGAHGQP